MKEYLKEKGKKNYFGKLTENPMLNTHWVVGVVNNGCVFRKNGN